MKRSALALSSMLLIAGALACTVSANIGDLQGSPVEAGADGQARDAEVPDASDDARTSDADGSSPPFDAGCGVDFPQEASFIDVQVKNAVPPTFTGGTIVPGIYELTAMNVYYAGTTGTVRIRETMRVRGATPAGAFDRLTEAQNASGSFTSYALHGETSTWKAPSGPSFFQTPECPKKDFEGTGRFSAQGDTLSVFDDQAVVERVYRRLH